MAAELMTNESRYTSRDKGTSDGLEVFDEWRDLEQLPLLLMLICQHVMPEWKFEARREIHLALPRSPLVIILHLILWKHRIRSGDRSIPWGMA